MIASFQMFEDIRSTVTSINFLKTIDPKIGVRGFRNFINSIPFSFLNNS